MFGFFRRRSPSEASTPLPPELDSYFGPLARLLAPRYFLKRRLSQGYRQEELLAVNPAGQQFVITCISPQRSDPELHRRLQREMAVASRLSHPRILPIVEYDCREDWFWWVRPWHEGQPLSQRLVAGPLELGQAVAWIGQIHDALDSAHSLGIVHRNLTPDTIWVNNQELWLSDFCDPFLFQRDVAFVGSANLPTPHYAAPEVITGAPTEPATDYFSLGAIAYHMLSGRTIFEGDPMAVIMKLLTESPPPLSPELPPALVELVASLLERDPAKRMCKPDGVRSLLSARRPALTSASEEMSQLLDHLQEEAQRVSSDSQFTLDAARALEKLRNFQFAEGYAFVVALVAAGQAMGCSRIDLTSTPGKLTVTYQNLQLDRPQLDNLWSYAFSRDYRGLSHLALGLAGALSHARARLTVTSGKWSFSCNHLDTPRLQRGLLAHDLSLTLEAELGEKLHFQLLADKFRHAPVPITCNGTALPAALQPNRPEFDGFALHFAASNVPDWWAVVDGIAFALPVGDGPSGRVVVWGELQVDLSYRGLVQNPALSSMLERLRLAVDQAIFDLALDEEFLTHPKHFRYALDKWREQSRDDLVLAFDRKTLRQAALGHRPQWLAESRRRLEEMCEPPLEYWRLLTHQQHLSREWQWGKIERIAARAFEDAVAALRWKLEVWLQWGTHQPDLEQQESLLHELRRLRLPPEGYEPAWREALPADLSEERRRRWHDLFPRDWLDCRAVLRD